MSLTIADSITRSRQIIQDLQPPFRHDDAKLVGYLNDALIDVRRLRPDFFLGGLDSYTFYDVTNLPDEFPLDPIAFTAVTDYISGSVGLEDDEFAQDGRAIALHSRFVQRLVGKGA